MSGFVQIIEFQTSRIDELEKLANEFRSQMQARGGPSPVAQGIMTADSDRAGYYLNIVQFESREAAMENSNRPETTEFAGRMAQLCDAPPRFYNLDVLQVWRPEGAPA